MNWIKQSGVLFLFKKKEILFLYLRIMLISIQTFVLIYCYFGLKILERKGNIPQNKHFKFPSELNFVLCFLFFFEFKNSFKIKIQRRGSGDEMNVIIMYILYTF